MENVYSELCKPWPWYIVGPLIGLIVPALLLAGNKVFGISSTLRQICAACFPGKVPFLQYDWKKESWNLFFAAGIFIGGFLAGYIFKNQNPIDISIKTWTLLQSWGIEKTPGLLPAQIFNWNYLLSLNGFLFMVVGGFLVGFGTRYAGGCTSGHGIFGLSTLQWPSLIAVCSFFAGGIFVSDFVLPYLFHAR
jgi:uncharacterized protein